MCGQIGEYNSSERIAEIEDNLWTGSGDIVVVFKRVTRGFGDALMLRNAIVGRIRSNPNIRYVLHIYSNVADIFTDIKGLEVVPLSGSSHNVMNSYSESLCKNYGRYIVYDLSDCDAKYECANMDHIVKSRQEIYCNELGITFSKKNYGMDFSNEELQVALDVVGDRECIGIHLKGAEKWRDYRFINIKRNQLKMWNIVERLAKYYDGYIVTFDNELSYSGRRKNILSFVSPNIRHTLAVMSLMRIGIGPDSFGVHGFGFLGVPVYGIFGPTDPAIRLKYNNAYWSPKSDCPYQYCWYKYMSCKTGISCLNARTSKFYTTDILNKLGDFLQ